MIRLIFQFTNNMAFRLSGCFTVVRFKSLFFAYLINIFLKPANLGKTTISILRTAAYFGSMTDIDKVIDEALHKDALADTLPFESWEKLAGETSNAFAAFCVFRDLGADRNIRKAVEASEHDKGRIEKRYGVFRNWASQFRWKERAADYDRYIEHLKQTELRKTIKAQWEKHRQVTGKMLDVVNKKLDTMNPVELTQGNLTEWVQTAIKAEREAAGPISPNGNGEARQGELFFTSDFQGI